MLENGRSKSKLTQQQQQFEVSLVYSFFLYLYIYWCSITFWLKRGKRPVPDQNAFDKVLMDFIAIFALDLIKFALARQTITMIYMKIPHLFSLCNIIPFDKVVVLAWVINSAFSAFKGHFRSN